MKLVFATNNKHKLAEVRSMLSDNIELVSLQDIACRDEIEETENTLEGNAKIKSDYIKNKYRLDCFADDTGLEVDALNGAPGVYSARYAGENASFEDNVDKLLHELKGQKNRKARFRTVVSLTLKGNQYYFEGICEGAIATSTAGTQGFGYDPVFLPKGFELTFAQMDMHEKAKISHRGIAIEKLVDFLNQLS